MLKEVHISMCFYDLLTLILHNIHFRILCNLWIGIFVHSELTDGHQCHSSVTVIISHGTQRRYVCTPKVHRAYWYWSRQMLNFLMLNWFSKWLSPIIFPLVMCKKACVPRPSSTLWTDKLLLYCVEQVSMLPPCFSFHFCSLVMLAVPLYGYVCSAFWIIPLCYRDK